MRVRYYSVELMRFINEDIVLGDIDNSSSLNRYTYVEGNPATMVDLFGLCAEKGWHAVSAIAFTGPAMQMASYYLPQLQALSNKLVQGLEREKGATNTGEGSTNYILDNANYAQKTYSNQFSVEGQKYVVKL